MPAKPTAFDECLAAASAAQRAALEKIRAVIKATAPTAEEGVSYGLAAFLLDGKPLAGLGAGATHCAYYPMSGSIVAAHQDALKKYETSKGTIRFRADRPLPAALVRKLVKARIAEIGTHKQPDNRKQKHSGVVPPRTVPIAEQVASALAWLEAHGTDRYRDNLTRFAITTSKAFGVSVVDMRVLAKQLGRNHELALALWDTGWQEARMLATLIDEPDRVTPAQMDRWCRDFDNWAVCDSACFCLFDRTPHVWSKIEKWCDRQGEFQKRASFALLASVALHDKKAADEPFLECLPLAERAATDERNFVKKGVVWALRGIAGRNPSLYAKVMTIAQRLADSADATSRWIGKTTLRELRSPASIKRLAAKQAKMEK